MSSILPVVQEHTFPVGTRIRKVFLKGVDSLLFYEGDLTLRFLNGRDGRSLESSRIRDWHTNVPTHHDVTLHLPSGAPQTPTGGTSRTSIRATSVPCPPKQGRTSEIRRNGPMTFREQTRVVGRTFTPENFLFEGTRTSYGRTVPSGSFKTVHKNFFLFFCRNYG